MGRKKWIILAAGIVCLAALSASLVVIQAAPGAPAAPSATYTIPWWTVDSGGGVSQGGSYILSGTIGQPDPGSLTGSGYQLRGGFWGGVLDYRHFLSLLFR
jgi:hypothetical protein